MSTKVAISIGISAIIVLLLSVTVGSCISYQNDEVRLRNQITAQINVNRAVYDETWKVISQQAQISDKYRDGFKEIYVGIMEARYSKGDGTLMKWIKEANPDFSPLLYGKLMLSIESLRAKFTNNQKTLADLKLQHDNLLDVFPGSLFLNGRQKIEIPIVTSSRTEDSFKTGKDDNVKL